MGVDHVALYDVEISQRSNFDRHVGIEYPVQLHLVFIRVRELQCLDQALILVVREVLYASEIVVDDYTLVGVVVVSDVGQLEVVAEGDLMRG